MQLSDQDTVRAGAVHLSEMAGGMMTGVTKNFVKAAQSYAALVAGINATGDKQMAELLRDEWEGKRSHLFDLICDAEIEALDDE